MNCLCCELAMVQWEEAGIWHCEGCGYGRAFEIGNNPYITEPEMSKVLSERGASVEGLALSALRLALIEGFSGPKPLKIFDIGCATGAFLQAAISQGHDGFGCDCSPFVSEDLTGKGISHMICEAESLNGQVKSAHVVTMFDVIEHLSDPTLVLLKAHSILKAAGGTILISTPDAEGVGRGQIYGWRHYKPGEHFHYFTNAALRHLLERTGFRDIRETGAESMIRVNRERGARNILTVVGMC